MKKSFTLINLFILAGIFTPSVLAQTFNLPDGKRLILTHNDGTTDAFAIEQIADMAIVNIPDSKASLSLSAKDDASLTVRAIMSEGCKSFDIICRPSSTVPSTNALEDFIIQNSTKKYEANGDISFIDLTPSTSYTVAALAYDEFGFPCDVTTLNASTDAASGVVEAVTAGGFLYADGSWSKELKNNKTPIGIIFSNKVSDKDKNAGYTHGYAIAFREVPEMAWTTEADETESGEYISSVSDMDIQDQNGRLHSENLLKNPQVHPAALAASTYLEAPASTSGWYLPSSGQLIDMFINLGSLSKNSLSRDNAGNPNWDANVAKSGINTINSKLSVVGEGNYDPLSIYNWTSSEKSVVSAYYIYCHPENGISLQNYYKDSKFAVRPVIAF